MLHTGDTVGKKYSFPKDFPGGPMAQWLRLCISNARGKVQSQVGEIRSYMLHSVAKKKIIYIYIYMFVCMYVCACVLSCSVFVTPWAVACQASLSMELSKQEYWSGLHFLLQGVSYIGRWILYHCATWEDEMKWKSLSCVQLFATPWTIQSMAIFRPEYWNG